MDANCQVFVILNCVEIHISLDMDIVLLTTAQKIGHLTLLVEVLINFVVTALIGFSLREQGSPI